MGVTTAGATAAGAGTKGTGATTGATTDAGMGAGVALGSALGSTGLGVTGWKGSIFRTFERRMKEEEKTKTNKQTKTKKHLCSHLAHRALPGGGQNIINLILFDWEREKG